MIVCAQCYRENDDDSDFCDQCGAKLDKGTLDTWRGEQRSDVEAAGPCPDCGGTVEETEPGKGVCAKCGATLVINETEESPVGADRARALAALIKVKLGEDVPLDLAVESACREFFEDKLDGRDPAPNGKTQAAGEPCPVCGRLNVPDTAQCSDCGVAFEDGEKVRCRRCGASSSEPVCSCGAILALSKLLEYMDPSVSCVCTRCRALFKVPWGNCPSCGGKVAKADKLRQGSV